MFEKLRDVEQFCNLFLIVLEDEPKKLSSRAKKR